MKKLLSISALLFALFVSQAQAAGTRPGDMTASGAIVGTQIVWCPTGTTADFKCTFTQVDTFINAQFSGDFTVGSTGVATLKNTGPGATGPIGSTTVTPVVTIDAQGRVTALGSATIAGPVSSVTGGIGVTVSPTTGAVVVSSPVTKRDNTATTDTITSADKGTVITESNASPVAVAITTAGFVTTDYFTVKNKGAGLVTYTPSSGTIDGAATLTVKQNQSADLYFDGTNYQTLPGRPTNIAPADLTGLGTGVATALGVNVGSAGAPVVNGGALGTPSSGTLTSATGLPISTGVSGLGTGVATAAAANVSAAGGLTSTIASGTSAMGTGAITSATCATVVTTAATNTATTDVVLAGFNGDPHAVTGYIPATAGMLTIIAYPTSGNVNFLVCNNTSGSITPGAITLNWRVVR